jgi:uncharacterized protein (TIGR02001 family)
MTPIGGRPAAHALCALLGALGSAAEAGEWGGSAAATTDYIYQGVTQSNHGAALQVDLHLQTAAGWFVGAWASTANPPPARIAGSEVNFYLGRSWSLNSRWLAALSYVRYWYPDTVPGPSYDYDEVLARLSFEDRAAASIACAPNVTRYSLWSDRLRRGRECAYEASLRLPVSRKLDFTAGGGYYDLSALFRGSYWAWNTGLSLELHHLQLTLTRFGAQDAARRTFGAQTADGHWALSAVRRF